MRPTSGSVGERGEVRRRDGRSLGAGYLVQNVIARLQELGGGEAIPLEGREENIVFEVPKELRVDVREVE